MKMLSILLLVGCMQLHATGNSQSISLSFKDTPLQKVLEEIEKQADVRFIYSKSILDAAGSISLHATNITLEKALELCLGSQFAYSRDGKFVVLRVVKQFIEESNASLIIEGKVVNEDGKAIAGVTIVVKGTNKVALTDNNGMFKITGVEPNSILIISAAEKESIEVSISDQRFITVTLRQKVGTLDETIIIGYGTTSKRLNTGSLSKVSAREIERQPVSNPLATMAGRIPGLMVTPANGLPGANISLLLRGENSLRQGTEPLMVVDGVPFMLNSERLTNLNSTDNQNLFNTIDPADIESIEVLKDASATAIYGSQGANGVILITTKKGKLGKTKVNMQTYMGLKRATRTMDLLSTEEYLEMRQEAFTNDQIIPNSSNAPDLSNWDPNRFTDWKKKLIGGTARNSNYKITLSGGSEQTQFLFSGNLYSETLVFPNSEPAKRGTARAHINHTTRDKRLQINLSTSYGADIKRQSLSDLTQYIFLPPNAPPMLDSIGNLLWTPGVDNPFAFQKRKYNSYTYSFLTNADIHAKLTQEISIKINAGYNKVDSRENATIPIKSVHPDPTARGSYYYSSGFLEGWIVEPQLHYVKSTGVHQLQLLAGSSLQSRTQQGLSLNASGYSDDDQLGNTTAAENIATTTSHAIYRYTALFGRIHYDFRRKYILDVNLRRDGSSRFGPAERFSNFGAVGIGWVFSDEDFVSPSLKKKFLHFGKIRASYGTTGNDQIGNYQYFDGWGTNSQYQYGGSPGFLPQRLFNSRLQWERTNKLQIGTDIEFFKGKVSLSVDYYRNQSNNQLTYVSLPQTTGFTSALKNLDASILNTGLELQLIWKVIDQHDFTWATSFNATIPRNKLLRYPNLENSTDASNYIVGKPMRIARRFEVTGVDPQTGVYQFKDFNGDGLIQPLNDWTIAGTLGQQAFGGLDNSVSYKNWNLHVFFHFVKQTGNNYLTSLPDIPGTLSNQPISVLERWRSPGDISSIQKFTSAASPASTAFAQFLNSTGSITDASFVRLKNIQLSFEVPRSSRKWLKYQQLRFSVTGQDLLTFTRYAGADPETRNVQTLPLLRTIAFGAQLIF